MNIMPGWKVLLAASVTLLLGACASYSGSSLVPGKSGADVKAAMGEPAGIHQPDAGDDFAESWEYPRGPVGRHTYMARFDKAGNLLRIDQVLRVKTFDRIKVGVTTKDMARRLLGRPGIERPTRQGGVSWDYVSLSESGFMRAMIISVDFDTNGLVVAYGERWDPSEEASDSRP